MDSLKNKWWSSCQLPTSNSYGSITVEMVGGAFIMLAVGIVLAIIVLCIQSITIRKVGTINTLITEIDKNKFKSIHSSIENVIFLFFYKP